MIHATNYPSGRGHRLRIRFMIACILTSRTGHTMRALAPSFRFRPYPRILTTGTVPK
jgi:hypothetical protein